MSQAAIGAHPFVDESHKWVKFYNAPLLGTGSGSFTVIRARIFSQYSPFFSKWPLTFQLYFVTLPTLAIRSFKLVFFEPHFLKRLPTP